MEAHTSSWPGRRVLVTGCGEFLGEAVTQELLRRGASIVGLIRERGRGAKFVGEIAAGRVHLVHGDCRDATRLHSAMAIHEVSAVFHLADVDSTAIDRAAGLYHSRVPVIRAQPPHQLSLAQDEATCSPLTGLARFDELFGPGDRTTTRAIARALFALAGRHPPVPATGAVRDYVFVRDAARACVELAETVGRAGHSVDRTYRSGWKYSDVQMRKILANAFEGSLPVPAPNSRSDSDCLLPELTFAEAIAETVAWFRQTADYMSQASPVRRAA